MKKRPKTERVVLANMDGVGIEAVVVRDSFYLHDTHGFPLGMQIAEGIERGVITSLVDFCRDAKKGTWKDKKIRGVIREALWFNGVPEEEVLSTLEVCGIA